MLFFLTIAAPTHRICSRDENGTVTFCRMEEWDPTLAQIPCQFLPPRFVECITHSFDKFANQFEKDTLPETGCPTNSDDNVYGMAICHPLNGIYCIGEQYWINKSYPCYEPGHSSVITAFLLSFILGIFGADRFYLGYYFLGFLKLFTLGGFTLWWVIDFILLAFGVWGPKADNYIAFY